MLRRILGVVAGVAVAILVVMAGELILHALAPMPTPDMSDPEALKTLMASAPLGAKIGLVVIYFLATVFGALTAARVSRTEWTGWIVGGVMLLATIGNFIALPHPAWIVATSIAVVAAGAWLGAQLGRRA